MKNKELNTKAIRLLRKVQAIIRKDESLYNQAMDGRRPLECDLSGNTYCGSAACIVGWLVYLAIKKSSKKVKDNALEKGTYDYVIKNRAHGKRMLFMTNDQLMRLWHAHNWPHPYYKSCNANVDASVAIARIDHFIETDGKE